MTSVKKFNFVNGCGEFHLQMKANTVLLNCGDSCFWGIVTDEKENGVVIDRTFYSVKTDDDLDIIGDIGVEWGVNYVGSWEEYHLFELIPMGGHGYEVPVEHA